MNITKQTWFAGCCSPNGLPASGTLDGIRAALYESALKQRNQRTSFAFADYKYPNAWGGHPCS